MIKSKNPISIRNFVNSNGFLRFILFVFTVICLGLAAGDYDETSSGDIYFLLIIIIAFILAFLAFLLSFIDTPHFKIQKHRQIDSTLHLYAAWFIFNASIAKLVCRTFESESRQAIQIAAGIFGFLISPLYAWLAYLTFVDKRSCIICHCLSNEVDEVDDEGKMQTIKSRQMLVRSKSKSSLHWDWKSLLMFSSIFERWSTVFDEKTRGKQNRLFSFILGFSTVILAGVSYRYSLRSEEYFMIVICINFFITLLFHLFYTLGISRIEKIEKELWIFDKSFHLTGGVFLFVAGNLFLASTFTFGDTLTPPRTLASVLGILNGILYFYIGLSIQGKEGENLVQNSTENEEDQKFKNMTLHGRKQGENGDKVMSSKQANNKFANQSKPALIFDPAKV